MSEPSYKVSFWFRKLLVPVDGSESSMKALELAADFNMRYGSEITVLYVRGPQENENLIRSAVNRRIGGRINFEFRTRRLEGDSSVANEILKEITEGDYDAVIMGARGKTTNPDLILGSVALAVVANSPLTVIIVR
ncbi:MAG: universal stress protein [Nitrososphaeria archaeon]